MSIYTKLKMRDVVHWSLEELMNHPKVPILLETDDNTGIETFIEEVTLSWFLWEFHRKYPDAPHLERHVMHHVVMTPKTHMKYLAVIQKDVFEACRKHEYEPLLPYNKIAFKVYNDLYNFVTGKLTRFMTSISILDYLDVMDHPKVKAANDRVKYASRVSSRDIGETYKEITQVLKKEKSLKDNPLAVALNHGLVSGDQIMQDIAPRGFVSDIDAHIFKTPIRVGYAEGMHKLTDYITESRTGTMADIMTGTPMSNSEYLNRLLQLSVSRIKNIHRGDCGSTTLFPWTIKNASQLQDFDGIYYLNEETGQQEPINADKDFHLVGKDIQIRLVFGCLHPDRETVCAKCYGDLAHNMHETDNPGHLSAIEHQSPQSQTVLSFKHLTGSASEFGIHIDDEASQIFDVHASEYETYVKPGVSLDGWKFRVPLSALRHFETLIKASSWGSVSPSRVSDVVYITTIDPHGDLMEMAVADLENPVYFSMEALKFLVKAPTHVHANGDYEFDMTGWKNNQPMFRIPKVQFDVVAYTNTLVTFIKGPETSDKRNTQKTIIDFDHPLPALVELYDMVSVRLHVNLSHLQCVILSSMTEDPENGDFHLPKIKSQGHFVSHDTIMRNGSAVVAFGYEKQQNDIFDPSKYLGHSRPEHLYDPLLLGLDAGLPD